MKTSPRLSVLQKGSLKLSLPPVYQLCLITLLLSFCCGPAYNPTPLRNFLSSLYNRSGESGFDLENKLLVARSLKVFQTADTIAGGCVGFLLGVAGPRFTHILGYICYAVGLLAMLRIESLWWGMLFQGICVQILLNSVLCLANLFNSGSSVAISVLSGSGDLAAMVYPVGLFLLDKGILPSPTSWVVFLLVITVIGCILSFFLLPDSPYFPQNFIAQKLIASELVPGASQGLGVFPDDEEDARDNWDVHSNPDIEIGENKGDTNAVDVVKNAADYSIRKDQKESTALLSSPDHPGCYRTLSDCLSVDYRRDSALSVSMIAAAVPSWRGSVEKNSLLEGEDVTVHTSKFTSNETMPQFTHFGLFAQMFSLECMLMAAVFTFSFIRVKRLYYN